jgi:hypothetical protein
MTEILIAKLDNLVENANQLDAHSDTAHLLQLLYMVRDTADSALDNAVAQARSEGMTWERIGHWMGTSRQAAHERHVLYLARAARRHSS